MPFQHAAGKAWSRWLTAVSASRPPNVKVVGQDLEDSLRGIIQVDDLVHLATPINWAQASTRRSVAAVPAEVSRVELHCLAAGGLWVQDVDISGSVTVRIEDAPLTAVDRVGVVDFGNIPTVSPAGLGSVVEASPSNRLPVWDSGGFVGPPLFLAHGKVLVISGSFQNTAVEVKHLTWREIPTPVPA